MIARFLAIAMILTAPSAAHESSPQPPENTESQQEATETDDAQATPQIEITVTSPEPNAEQTERANEQREREIVIQERIGEFTRVLAIVAALQLVLVFGGLMATIRAANAAKNAAAAATKSAEIAERALVLTERAYVQIVGWVFKGFVADRISEIKYQIKNFGRTPATVLMVEQNSVYLKKVPAHPPPLISKKRSGVSLGSGVRMGQHFTVGPALDTDRIALLKEDKLLWLTYVRVTYQDQFSSDPRVFQTCMRWSPTRKELVVYPEAGYEHSN